MKGTSPSKASREQLELRFTATEYQDGEVKLFINSTERGNHDHRNHWSRSGKERLRVQGMGESGKPELARPKVPRSKLLKLIAGLLPCLIGMEAFSGAHHWAKVFVAFGH
jgi:hypothetical protein